MSIFVQVQKNVPVLTTHVPAVRYLLCIDYECESNQVRVASRLRYEVRFEDREVTT